MADTIAVMRGGKIEQLGTPGELYERPRTAFVAGFLGVSNLLRGTVSGDGVVHTDEGVDVRVTARLPGAGSRVAVGVRPEQLRLQGDGVNRVSGVVAERAYTGVATQYAVDTPAGRLTVFVQAAGAPVEGDTVEVVWDAENTFVVQEEP
jgi:spermidine/putrescine transport system ATP-binding protein